MLEFLHVVVQYSRDETLNFYKQVDLPKPVKYVMFTFGEELAHMAIEDTTYDLDRDCLIHDLGVISRGQMLPEEIKELMKGWAEEVTESAPQRT